MYGQQNKWCFVPGCTSTSVSTSNKIFVSVPGDYAKKERWFKAARRDMPKSKSTFYCCEDHFNLEEDMANYIHFKLMGGRMIMKPDVVPHKFDCQPDWFPSAPDSSLSAKRTRELFIEQILQEQKPTEEPK